MKWGWYWTTGTSASRHFSFRQPCLSTSVTPVCSFWTYVVPCSWTCWSMEAGSTWIWRPGAGDPSVRRDTGLTGACAGCWWAGRREMECFQLHRQKGAKNAKKEESESFLKQKVKRLCKKEQQSVGNSA